MLDRKPIDRMILSTWDGGLRVVLAVYGKPDDAPRTEPGPRRLLHVRLQPAPPLPRRQRRRDLERAEHQPLLAARSSAPTGRALAPADYEALLARCWDVLHAARPNVNVIAASSPRGNDNPAASSNVGHSPATFYRKLGLAYRASGRAAPILDTVGHNPYPVTNAERPWVRHPVGGTIAEGDYDKLMSVLTEAFGGTGQPLPGQRRVAIWYMEQGFQTTVDPAKAGLYRGTETDRQALPAWVARTTTVADPGRTRARPGDAALRRAAGRLLPAGRRRVLQLRARRRGRTSAAGSPVSSGPT